MNTLNMDADSELEYSLIVDKTYGTVTKLIQKLEQWNLFQLFLGCHFGREAPARVALGSTHGATAT